MATFREFLRFKELSAKDKTFSPRMKEILHIMRQHHVAQGMTPQKAVAVLEALGPTYVKIGQLASNRSDILPKEYCEAFEKLHDNVSPMSFDVVVECIDASYGHSYKEVFAAIDPVPLGAASIAQVHKATLKDGTVVAVKVRRPGVVEQMAEDIAMMKSLLAFGDFATTAHKDIIQNLTGFVNELERTTENEVDFTIELENLVRFRKELKTQPGVTCPVPYPQYSTDSVLVEEYVTGTEISDVERLKKQGVDMKALSRRLIQSYVTQVLDNGFFHADPHSGNIIVRDKQLVWIDLGMVGTLTGSERMLVSRMFRSVAFGNAYELMEAVLGLCSAKGSVDEGLLLEKMDHLLAEYGQADMANINIGDAFQEVIEVLRRQNLIMTPSVTMLARGFVTLEGLLTEIAPDTSVIDVVSQHVMKQMFDPHYIGEKATTFMYNSVEAMGSAARLPTQLSHALAMLTRGQMSVKGDLSVPEDALATVYVATGRLALAIMAAGLFLGSAILCTTDMAPKLLGVPLLGVLGFVGAFVLSVFVLWRTLRTRHRFVNGQRLE